MVFKHAFKVNSHLCDYNRIARPGAVMTYLQECANLHLETYGPRDTEMRADGHVFVLSRIGIAVHSPLHAYEELTAETWASPSHGYSFFRCHRILRGDEVICEATSVWALIGIEDKRPQRADTLHLHFDTKPLSAFGVPDRIRINRDLLQKAGEHVVGYRDTDLNMHMNNTVYADVLCAHLDMKNRYASHLSINYFREAPLGTRLDVFKEASTDNPYLFRTVREDGETNIEAAITLSPIP